MQDGLPDFVLRIKTGAGGLLSEPMIIHSAFSPDVIVNVLRIIYVRGESGDAIIQPDPVVTGDSRSRPWQTDGGSAPPFWASSQTTAVSLGKY